MSVRPDVGLERLIDGFEQELLAAPDEEFTAGARDLGMNPQMKGSAAFIGVRSLTPQLLAALQAQFKERSSCNSRPIAGEPDEGSADAAEPGTGSAAKGNVDA
ncbi:MAG TPA: hypothetical protein VMC02_16010 [Steroidobacteraceae bacterium]|nr:hypothetical protein [Steroidobacteraceae bacterium]